MRIAIVGAGISGLATAHMLHREHEITVFEAGTLAGGHANTVRVDTEDATHHVDTGFIVFNDRNYPNFERLLSSLGVASQPSDMSFGVSDGGDFEYNGSSPNGLFAKRAHLVTPWFHRMVADLVRFNGNAREAAARPGAKARRSGHWLDGGGYSRAFVERLIVPQASAVWSADPRQMWTFPARFLVEFFANHGMLGFAKRPQWRTVVGGSRTYVDAVTRPWRDRLRLDTPITAIDARRGRRDRHAARRRGRALRRGRAGHALRPGAGAAARRDRPRARDPRRDPVPAQRGRAAHRPRAAAAAPARVGELELPPAPRADRADDGHVPHEPPAGARRRPRVLRDAQPHRTRSTRRRCCGRSPTPTRSSPPRAPARRPATRRSAGATARTTPARTGTGASTRTASRARCAWPSASVVACDGGDVRGHDPAPPLRGARARLQAPDRAGLRGPAGAAAGRLPRPRRRRGTARHARGRRSAC